MPQSNVYRRRQIMLAQDRGEKLIARAIQPVLDVRYKALSRELRQGNLRKRLKKFGGDYEKAKIPDDKKKWRVFFRETLQNSIREAGNITWAVEQSYFQSRGFPPIIMTAEVLQQYFARSDTRITGITQNMEIHINDMIARWFNTDAGLPELIEQLSGLFNENKATLIATTETRYVASEVALNTMSTYNIERWQWDAFDDGRTCETCMDLMVQSRSVPFYRGDPMPPDPSHPGCRCGVYYVGVDVTV